MRNKIIQLSLFIGLICSLAGFAQAQTVSEYRIDIPFDFIVGEKNFQAGEYEVRYGGLTSNREILLIRSRKGKEAALLAVMPKEADEKVNDSMLVFRLYENRYYLTGIESPRLAAEVYRSKAKTMIAKNSRRVEVIFGK